MSTDINAPMSARKISDPLQLRAWRLGLYGLCQHWGEITDLSLLERIVAREETERAKRSLERRVRDSRIGKFKPLADFDWKWPSRIDRAAIEDLMGLDFLREAANPILIGPNGVGKTMIAKNIAHRALLAGHTVRFSTASELLSELAAQDGSAARARRLKAAARLDLLVIDEIGYLSYDNRFADLLFEVISMRYQERSTVITTNRPFGEWPEVFPNAACVVTLVDRLTHCAEVVQVEANSYRLREAELRAQEKKAVRAQRAKGA
jgi:DNA replication protein DnaC